NDTNSGIDLSALSSSGFYGGSDTAANRGSFGAGTAFSAVFTGEAAGQVDFATIGTETYLHMAGAGGGYSTSDLLIHPQGTHALSAANVHL
ncbi:MAG: hypothetical protein JO021_03845, partial [Alphaproteobacteria bacterium]|nr:hypothetical protein [Alphaproteobacteria bacterium]